MFHQLSKIRLRLWDQFWYVSLCHCTFMQYRSNSFSNLNCLRMYNHVVSLSHTSASRTKVSMYGITDQVEFASCDGRVRNIVLRWRNETRNKLNWIRKRVLLFLAQRKDRTTRFRILIATAISSSSFSSAFRCHGAASLFLWRRCATERDFKCEASDDGWFCNYW